MKEDYTQEMFTADMKAVYDELDKLNKIQNEINQKELNFVKQNINYPLELMELDDIDWKHEGYAEIEKSNYKSSSYQSHEFYKEKNNPKSLTYMKQNHIDNYHNMVWQQTGYIEDDYSGFLLFPLTNGKYWKISYNC